jgi:predicted nuclease with RNAse H fold
MCLISVGIDLAGSERRNTGFCVMDSDLNCKVSILHTDEEIVENTLSYQPDVVSIDAPLFLPKGRKNLESIGPPHLRVCDKELLKMGIRFFPITLGPMRMLASRGISLRKRFIVSGLTVIESYPGAVQDILGMPRKQRGKNLLRNALLNYGLKGDVSRDCIDGDELDAITSALVGKLYLENDYIAIGDPDEGYMILPKVTNYFRYKVTGGGRA